MPPRPSRSLKHEYELFVEREIENYKESVPRSVLLSIGDDAVRALADAQQFALTELLLWDEVDRIIFKRLRLPSYATWRKRRLRLLSELRRPEHWGWSPDDAVVRAVAPVSPEAKVLVAGAAEDEDRALLYLAAHGCEVTALANDGDVRRVLDAAEEAGLGERIRATAMELGAWTPEEPLTAVIYTPAAFAGLSAAERARVIQVLQSATADGGVHLVRTIAAGKRAPVSVDELRRRYRGWVVTVEEGSASTFLARKGVA
jgi:hypothetical protein